MTKRKAKRWLAGILACLTVLVVVITSYITMISYAASFTGKNIWSGGSELIFGENRSYLYRWSDGYQNTFCIKPGQHMSSKVIAGAGRYHIDDNDIPYLSSTEDFRRLALICDWYEKKAGAISATNASYSAGQVAVWAVVSGQWENAAAMAAKVNTHVAGTSIKMSELLSYVETAYAGADGLPEWVSVSRTLAAEKPQNMTLEDGQYQLSLDISSCSDLGQVSWELPSGFSQSSSGTMLIFTYNGAGTPAGIIKGQAPASLAGIVKNSENLTIYVPENQQRDQAMISAGLSSLNELYINIGGAMQSTPGEEAPLIERFRHKETFEANYLIDLQKYCAETGIELEGSTFDVLEAFDRSQLGNGRNGTVSETNMSPRPATWSGFRICTPIRTDEEGYADHSDRKWYSYDKTYCYGHPEPEYIECTHNTGEGNETDNGEAAAEECSCEEENQRLREEWEALAALCEEETDFHDMEKGAAREQMIDDRDATYDTFINLVYQYTVKETGARPGYIVHGNHNDDIAIETIASDASEAGANVTVVAAGRAVKRENTNIFNIHNPFINTGRRLAGLAENRQPGMIWSQVPEAEVITISERRDIIRSRLADNGNATSSNSSKISVEALSATGSNAEISDQDRLDVYYEAAAAEEEVEIYDNLKFGSVKAWMNAIGYGDQYLLYPLELPHRSKPVITTGSSSISMSVSLPEPELDHVANVIPGASGNLSYTFRVENHRTEGEIHINKRDLELFGEDETGSYGKTQGDATLEGAVYGLFAGADIIHPDGKTGIVYKAGDLVSIGTTDFYGDASFLVITEESETSLQAANRNGTWIGHPLLLGSYGIKELSRSEGYELSVTGIDLTESNRQGDADQVHIRAGEASATGLSHRIDNQDGSWNETTVSYYKTEAGFDVVITGYPEHSQVFEVRITETDETDNVVIDSQLMPKTDTAGNPVYQQAVGGELKLDAAGQPIVLGDVDISRPLSETWYLYYRTGGYPSGAAEPELDPVKWADPETVDEDYIQSEVNHMLSQLGYRLLDETNGDGAPWMNIQLTAATNAEIGIEILDWYAANNFWNSAAVESITFNGSHYEARIFYDYQGQSGSAIYDSLNQVMYIKKRADVSGGASSSHAWLAYPAGSFTISGFYTTVAPKSQYQETIPFGTDMADYLDTVYQPLYDRYAEGEVLLDSDGNPIPVMEWSYTYADVTEVIQDEVLTPVSAVYDSAAGTYTIHVDNQIDWETVHERQTVTYRIQAPENSITVDGIEMDYSDYLVQVVGAGVTVLAAREEVQEGSYIKYQDLVYPGQIQVYQDGSTRSRPVQVLQRMIKQPVKVTKDVSQESYHQNNTYKIHRDPFTVLFGGYNGNGKKYIADFHFKIYLVSELEKAGLLTANAEGFYDYKLLFDDETKRNDFDRYAIPWDRPDMDLDGDLTTLHASEGTGQEPYYGRSAMLPYGTYVVVEQIPRNLVNKHYQLDAPKEIILPFVPQIDPDGTVHEDIPSTEYLYFSSYSAEELQERFLIRFNEEMHVIKAHTHDGDFEVYKYGLDADLMPDPYGNAVIGERYRYGVSENAGKTDNIYYPWLYDQEGNVIDYGVTLSNVDTMTGVSTAINGTYAAALVPWSVLDPRYGEVINDKGDIGNRFPGLENGSFNFIAFAVEHFENTFYSSKLRVEKLDSQTGENIIHEGAVFKIYAASRDVAGVGTSQVTGSGEVLFETITITGSRAELEARGDVDDITWDIMNKTYTGTVVQPIYDESEQIWMLNEVGEEVGLFKAFSTEHSVRKADGSISKEKTGYIETYQPLGAGVYVLVEVQAPAGYQKSKPIAFEIYRDETAYYPEGNFLNRTVAGRYQYVIPVTTTEEVKYQDVAQVTITDSPSKLYIHKVEDGDHTVGDENGLNHLTAVNDEGDLLTYIIRGRKEYLEARGDVSNITWDEENQDYFGTVTKTYDEWSERLIAGSEGYMLETDHIKPLYHVETGHFSGYGIRFGVVVKDAVMSLYEGLQIQRTGQHTYEGVTVIREAGAVVSIHADRTGSHLEITTNEQDAMPPYYPIWDTEEIANAPFELYFYDLSEVASQRDEITGELWILDDSGNRICYADSLSGMAYTYDDYGHLIAYRSVAGEKVLARSIEVHHNGEKDHIYINLVTEDDEVGLPLYYQTGELTYRTEQWRTDGNPHEIERLAFGAYILEETEVPYEQGYIKVSDVGLILRESSAEQHFYFQNIFTKLNIAKIDITTKEEIRDAQMTLYHAVRMTDDSERGYYLEKGSIYTSWISGYEYDDSGNLKSDQHGSKIPTTKPYWIDHIPVGDYILEETIVPYDQGYVQSQDIEITVTETGNVQTDIMEDDYTGLEVRKYDTKTEEVLESRCSATLALYRAELDADGKPLMKDMEDIDNLVVRWQTDDGAQVAATGREVTDEYGDTHVVYDYNRIPITTTKKGYYYITERGTTMFHYLPVGYYVLVEERTPVGYATADNVLIEVTDMGHLEKIHYYEMPDVPLTVEIAKVQEEKGREVVGAFLQLFRVDEFGVREEPAVYEWYTGTDGVYTAEDAEAGVIPPGWQAGDLRSHRIEYIPLGDYVLTEAVTPYGFLKADDVYFSVMDTPEVQCIEMTDRIPEGILYITKRDSLEEDWLLEAAVFELWNQTTGERIETLVTDESGTATLGKAVPIGYLNRNGEFSAYTYEVIEVDAPDTHMINRLPFEFQFQYQNEYIPVINLTYDAVNDINQIKISKKELTSKEELSGAEMTVTEKDTGLIIDHWISTEQPHYISGVLPGIYILTELATPGSGYVLAESIEFEVTENMELIPYIEMFDDHTETVIEKAAGSSGRLLAGARLQLETKDGTILYQWMTTADEGYRMIGLEPGQYVLREIAAPAGYRIGSPAIITIEDETAVQTFTYRNYKVSTGGGDITSEKKPEQTIGNMIPEYVAQPRGITGEDTLPYGPLRLPRSGDDGQVLLWIAALLLSFSGIVVLTLSFYQQKGTAKKKGTAIKVGFLLGLGMLLFLLRTITVYAEEPPATIEQVSVLKEEEKDTVPAYTINHEESEYLLQEWRLESVETPKRREAVSETVVYKDLEYLDEIAPEISIELTDEMTGQKQQVVCLLTETVSIGERWEDDFAVPVICYSYPADAYYLGDVLITEEQLMTDIEFYQADILAYLNLPSADYQIDRVVWDGEAYTSEQGESCRRLYAYGRRCLKDYQSFYEGEAFFEAYDRYQLTAVYALNHISSETEVMEMQPEPATKAEPEPVIESAEVLETEPLLSAKAELIVERETKPVLLIRIGAGFIIFFLAVLLWFAAVRSKKIKN